jgi:hypothetical protein
MSKLAHRRPSLGSYRRLRVLRSRPIGSNAMPTIEQRRTYAAEYKIPRQAIRTIAMLAVAALCASCQTDSSTDLSSTEPIISNAESNAREECLHQEVARLLEPKGSPLSSLQTIAVTATNFCSQTIATKLKGVSASAAKEDQVKTEQHAFKIGLELRERRASR